MPTLTPSQASELQSAAGTDAVITTSTESCQDCTTQKEKSKTEQDLTITPQISPAADLTLRKAVVGSLHRHLQHWITSGADPIQTRWLTQGVRILFDSPPRKPIPRANRHPTTEQYEFIQKEIQTLSALGAVEPYAGLDAWCWPLMAVPKKGNRKWRLVVDMSQLTPFVHSPTFKLETLEDFLAGLRPGWNLWTADLRDGYFHVLMHPADRHLLGFRWGGKTFVYRTLPFGLRSSPYVFTKLMRLVMTHCRTRARAGLNYIDDFAFAAPKEETQVAFQQTLEEIRRFGAQIAPDKTAAPDTTATILGLVVDTLRNRVTLPEDKISAVITGIKSLLGTRTPTLRDMASLAGRLNFAARAVPILKAYAFGLHCRMKVQDWDRRVRMSDMLRQDLKYVKRHIRQWASKGAPIWNDELPVQVRSDASTSTGWGYVIRHGGHVVATGAGTWLTDQKCLHINVLELMVPLFAIRLHRIHLQHRNIEFRLDNVTAVACLRRAGGPSRPLNQLAREIRIAIHDIGATATFHHLRGVLNWDADALSRGRYIVQVTDADPDSWMLHPELFKGLDRLWGPHEVDWFACPRTAQVPTFWSRDWSDQTAGVNSLTADWGGVNGYANPPFGMIMKVLVHAEKTRARLTLIVPVWPARPWWPLLGRLAVDWREIPRSTTTFLAKGAPVPGKATTWRILAVRIQFGATKTREFYSSSTSPATLQGTK